MDWTYFLKAATDPIAAHSLWRNAVSVMDSSLNQRMGPRDCNYALREERDGGRTWKVLVDYEGPGCITRFWTAGAFDGELELYLDGEREPALRTTLVRFFAGEALPFEKPLVMDETESSGGRVSYWPIPFAKGCKIRVCSDTTSLYWQINALRFRDGAGGEVVTFRPAIAEAERRAVEALKQAWTAAPTVPAGTTFRTSEAPAGAEAALWERDGAGTIERFAVRAADVASLDGLSLRAYWDGEAAPSVDVPLAHLFCLGSKDRAFASKYVSRVGDMLTFAMPMPFERGARLRLHNATGQPASLTWAAEAAPREPGTGAAAYRLHAAYRRERLGFGVAYQALKVTGAGLFVGMNQVMAQLGEPAVMHFHQEGNEYMYVDHDADPSWLGTGTEDYYNCGYYYQYGEVDAPTHGCLDLRDDKHGGWRAGLVSAYRFHLLDAVPFRRKLLLVQEAGCPKKGALVGVNGKEALDYQWTCYWYETPQGEPAASTASSEEAEAERLTL